LMGLSLFLMALRGLKLRLSRSFSRPKEEIFPESALSIN
jgi:hypothetical protein